MDEQTQQCYLDAMGIQRWVLRGSPQAEPERVPPEVIISTAETEQSRAVTTDLSWDDLAIAVKNCQACELHQSRTQVVFGVGNRQADLLVIGEAPGADEDRQGEPFVGPAGQLLNQMLFAIGLHREQVFISNILKCRPPGNRDSHVNETLHCEPFLRRQIELIQPKVILSVGRIPAHNLLKCDTPVGHLRGQIHHYGEQNIPLIVTCHPAYLLRSPDQKGKSWQDLQLALQTLRKLSV